MFLQSNKQKWMAVRCLVERPLEKFNSTLFQDIVLRSEVILS